MEDKSKSKSNLISILTFVKSRHNFRIPVIDSNQIAPRNTNNRIQGKSNQRHLIRIHIIFFIRALGT